MSDNNSTKLIVPSLEAPASWNTRYQTPEGFVCQITLRADSGKELLEKAGAALNHLLATGCTPYEQITFRPKSNGNGHKAQNNGSQGSTPAEGSEAGEAHICPVHNVEMKRWEKDGRIWYSHKQGNAWCTGK